MSKYSVIFLVIIVAGLVWLYFSKASGHDQAMKRLIEKHQDAMDSSALEAERWRRIAKEYGDEYRNAASKALKSEQRLSYLREENERLKRKPVIRYNEPQLDSIFSGR